MRILASVAQRSSSVQARREKTTIRVTSFRDERFDVVCLGVPPEILRVDHTAVDMFRISVKKVCCFLLI